MADSLSTSASSGAHPAAKRRTLHAIAVFEAVKGLTALAAMVGVLDLMHRDVRHIAIELIGRFGFDPDGRYPSLLLHYAELLPDANVPLLVLLGTGYVLVRLCEGYGLWNDRAWGEQLGALSGGLYVPFEVYHLWHRPTAIGAVVLASNLFLVAFLAVQLLRRRRAAAA